MVRIYTSKESYRHDTGPGHPETAARIDAVLDGVRRAGVQGRVVSDPPLHPDTDRIIAAVHSADYSRELQKAAEAGSRLFHSLDNPISSGTWTAARTVVSLALTAVDDIWRKRDVNRGFIAARPPGHHAEKTRAMGFCFFNTIACAAEALREIPGVERVFIFDWDVHHGNGTQNLFEQRDDIYYSSIHRYPFYPGTGAARDVGSGRGLGFTRNIPLEEGLGDSTYLRFVEEQIVPAIEDFEPQAILISAGFDAHRRDPLGGMSLTEEAYGEMTRQMVKSAEKYGGGRVLSVLEGGYDPEGIAASVAEHLKAMA